MSPILLNLLLVGFATAESFRCYDCAGPLGKNLACERSPREEATQECFGSNVCAKFVVKTPGESILNRACKPIDICNTLSIKYDQDHANSLGECWTCADDLCNSAAPTLASLILSIVTLLIAICFK